MTKEVVTLRGLSHGHSIWPLGNSGHCDQSGRRDLTLTDSILVTG
ncbi:MAG TPA: hypothetical protein VGR69_06105 [Candidatus Rubrimentiphilum sp.]|nr:hypothetical protein [Candidatus Rubrimentiphilum sp.]